MPGYYRRRGGRFGRRYRLRRRSFRRRRPNAARATNRITLVPRHQYLKLKANISWTGKASAVSNAASNIWLNLQDPGGCLLHAGTIAGFSTVTLTRLGSTKAYCLGWTEYDAFFDSFCVHGVKYRVGARVSHSAAALSNNQGAGSNEMMMLVTPQQASAVTDLPLAHLWGSMPLGKAKMINQGTGSFRGYVNMNKLFGELVKKHDRYVHKWDPVNDSAHVPGEPGQDRGFLGFGVYAVGPNSHDIEFYWTASLTYYLSAMSINNALTPSAAMLLKEMSQPVSADTMLGEINDPDTQARTKAVATGVATTRAGLDAAGQRGAKRVYIDEY